MGEPSNLTAASSPEIIWATVNGSSTRLGFNGFHVVPNGRQLIGGWSEFPRGSARPETKYVRADIQPSTDVKALVKAAKSLADRVQIEGDCNGIEDETWQALADLRAALELSEAHSA